jgi:hypothetical protein
MGPSGYPIPLPPASSNLARTYQSAIFNVLTVSGAVLRVRRGFWVHNSTLPHGINVQSMPLYSYHSPATAAAVARADLADTLAHELVREQARTAAATARATLMSQQLVRERHAR